MFCEERARAQSAGVVVRGVGDGGSGDEVVPSRPGGCGQEGVEDGLRAGVDGGGCADGEGGGGLGAPVGGWDGGDELRCYVSVVFEGWGCHGGFVIYAIGNMPVI